jgi:hypothetical protein
VAWPIVVLVIVLFNQNSISETLKMLVRKISSAKKITVAKWLQLEDRVDNELEEETAKTAQTAEAVGPTKDVPKAERRAAERVLVKLNEISPDTSQTLAPVRSRMIALAKEYETIRESMAPGAERTRRMNGIVAQMRTISLAAKPLLTGLSHSDSPGRRLAAITILQMSPNAKYADWLAERMATENPFIFFHAALALLETVRAKGTVFPHRLRRALNRAKSKVESFKEGPPDSNTLEVLAEAINELNELMGTQ